ncbi:MAG: RagB/SusD family nutrient uptake outer membrane protein [Proteiniphilum sp.]|uniref:RagB/SusD family nutrient uptake outer membrane protein n=1 Tax=Proteiniphilum sp. TaxID=1926877 RepID=UPI002AB9390D|nr:RagB/SusD family nutrient uptake outer membrane protein [Proteiniphilum sp.]MDY9918684.1 RagB/SusD family nutrient uptake outer membrane protein [Proteiniphilum sp.]
MKKIRFGFLFLTILPFFTFYSCFNLDEQVFSEVTEESFIPTEKDMAALLASAYSPLTYIMNWQGYFDLQEEPADCIITPTRPNGWDDGGTYRRMHQHQWTSEQWQPYNTYLTAYEGINNANRVMDQVKSGSLPVGELGDATIAELRAIRALWYSILLDTHGNVPLVTAFTDEIPEQASRQQIYDFVVTELTEAMPDLSEKNDRDTYGRMNKWAAYMVLARVYLNAKVYTGTEQYAKALECVNEIIKSGLFELSTDFSDNFTIDVDYRNKEFIFAVPYDKIYAGAAQHAKWYPPVARFHFGSTFQTWDGSCANPQFINSYQEGDKRLEKTWLMGPQYSITNPTQLVWTCLNYLPSLTCFKGTENHTSIDYGYRVAKWEFDNTATFNWGHDFPYFRYAETLLIKAECLLRLGQEEEVAADLVSQIRRRVFDNEEQAKVTVADLKADTKIKYGTLDWDNNLDVLGDQTPVQFGGLYDEWGWEFACEAQRRIHMIRFGTFSIKNWFNHIAVTDGHTAIFPIPYEELQSNKNLSQNPGYSM